MSKINRKSRNGNRQAPGPREVVFALETDAARSVHLAGDFNAWRVDELPLREETPGRWWTKLFLAPGTYQYRFIVDGQWVDDPKASRRIPNGFGSCNCELEVL